MGMLGLASGPQTLFPGKKHRGSSIISGLAIVVVLTFLTNGCGPNKIASNNPKTDEAQSLLIYTGRDKQEVESVVGMFEQKYPQYKGRIRFITLAAQAAVQRLRAEKSNPQAGFLWGGTVQGLQQLSNDGILVPSNPLNANLLDQSRRDSQGRWYAEMLLPEVIVYNHDLLKPEHAPRDWDDLISPAFKGKIVIRDVNPSGTMRTIFSALIYRQISAPEHSVDAGYHWLKNLDANTLAYADTPDDMYLKLDRGVGIVTLWNLQDALIQAHTNNRPWSYVMPDSGVPVLLDGVGVVDNPKSTQAAQDFENFLLEPQLQVQLAKDYYQIPAMQLPDSEKPEWLAKLNLKEMRIDWNLITQKQPEWMEYWAQQIKRQGGR
jgi:iron(III) transport system substrate-binding protein